jgi:hypothetical protein
MESSSEDGRSSEQESQPSIHTQPIVQLSEAAPSLGDEQRAKRSTTGELSAAGSLSTAPTFVAQRTSLAGSRRSQFAIAYTAEQVDEAVAILEQHHMRFIKTTTKTKGQAVERDILAAAGSVRMFLVAAYAGEKDKLNEVFGGDCERVGRLNHVMDNTVFRTEESKRDARWGDLRKALEIICSVLKEQGLYRPWKPAEDEVVDVPTPRSEEEVVLPPPRDLEGVWDEVCDEPFSGTRGLQIAFKVAPGSSAEQVEGRSVSKNVSVEVEVRSGETIMNGVATAKTFVLEGAQDKFDQLGNGTLEKVDMPWGGEAWRITWSNGGVWVQRTVDVSGTWDRLPDPEDACYGLRAEQHGYDVRLTKDDDDDDEGTLGRFDAGYLSLPDAGLIAAEASSKAVRLRLDDKKLIPSDLLEEFVLHRRDVDFSGSWDAIKDGEAIDGRRASSTEPVMTLKSRGAALEVDGVESGSVKMVDGAFVVTFDDGAVADAVNTNNMQFRGKDVRWEKRPQDVSGEWKDDNNESIIIRVTQRGAKALLSIPGEIAVDAQVTVDALNATLGGEKVTGTIGEDSSIHWSNGQVWSRPGPQLRPERVVQEALIGRVSAFEVPPVADVELRRGSSLVLPENWMLFMVHKVYMNDPEVTSLSFENMDMKDDPRIAKKLVQGLHFNTHLTELNLSNSQLKATEGVPLGEALKDNKTLTVLNVESSFLDVPGLLSIAEGLKVNHSLETLKLNGLKSLLKGVGASVEEAFAKAIEKNTTLTKLGLNLSNPHWRDMIDRKLTQNADKRRKTRLLQKKAKMVTSMINPVSPKGSPKSAQPKTAPAPATGDDVGQENAPPTVQPSGYPTTVAK